MMFGSNREHHKGLVTAMAFESLIKLFGLLAVGGYVLVRISVVWMGWTGG